MKNLPNIELPKKDINLMLKSPFSIGGEAIICHGYDSHTLYKLFIKKRKRNSNNYHYRNIEEMPDSKYKKLKLLYQMNLEDSVQPISTLSCAGRLIGYEVTYDEDDLSFDLPDAASSRDDILYYSDYVKRVLEYYASKDIIYADVASRNILINRKTRRAKFCDMDNIKIAGIAPEATSPELLDYKDIRGFDRQTDAYLHNIMLMRKLGLKPRQCLEDEDLFLAEFEERALPILRSIQNPKDFNGEYAIQYVKRR